MKTYLNLCKCQTVAQYYDGKKWNCAIFSLHDAKTQLVKRPSFKISQFNNTYLNRIVLNEQTGDVMNSTDVRQWVDYQPMNQSDSQQ